jgi:hypothetical protein
MTLAALDIGLLNAHKQLKSVLVVVQECQLLQPHLAARAFSAFIGVETWNMAKKRGFYPTDVEIKEFRCFIGVWINSCSLCGDIYAESCPRLHVFFYHVNEPFV